MRKHKLTNYDMILSRPNAYYLAAARPAGMFTVVMLLADKTNNTDFIEVVNLKGEREAREYLAAATKKVAFDRAMASVPMGRLKDIQAAHDNFDRIVAHMVKAHAGIKTK